MKTGLEIIEEAILSLSNLSMMMSDNDSNAGADITTIASAFGIILTEVKRSTTDDDDSDDDITESSAMLSQALASVCRSSSLVMSVKHSIDIDELMNGK